MRYAGFFFAAALGVFASGCLDWAGAWKRAQEKEKANACGGGSANSTAASKIQKKIENHVPEWDVYLSGDHAIKAIPRGGATTAVVLDDDHQPGVALERHVRAGRLSLLDMLAIADQIEQQHYRLKSIDEDDSGGTSHGFGHHHGTREGLLGARGEEGLGAEEPEGSGAEDLRLGTARSFGHAGSVARAMHDELIAYVRDHVNGSACTQTCNGSYAMCSQAGSRCFGGGVPCQIGGESTTGEYTTRYGYSWCSAGFCPAMRNVVEGWTEAP